MHVLLNDRMQLSDGVLKEVRPQRCTVGLAVGFAGQRGRTLPEASVGACACPYLVEWLQLLPRCLRVHTSSPLSINQSTINHSSNKISPRGRSLFGGSGSDSREPTYTKQYIDDTRAMSKI